MELNFSAFNEKQIHQKYAAINQAGPNDVVNSGWIPPDNRDRDTEIAHRTVLQATPPLQILGDGIYRNATRVMLSDCWQKALGEEFLGVHQITGSCVGAGGGNALFSLAAADIVKRNDPERAEIPFWLIPYGISRMLAGLNDRGDGSLGSTFARAIKEYGHIPADEQGLPAFRKGDGYIWGEQVELDWSQGKKVPATRLEASKKHLVHSTALCRNTDDVREAIKNFYAVTIASNWGGLMRPPQVGTGEFQVLLNRRATTWNHQMSVQGWWDHPEFGEIFYILNQWGRNTHGICPSGAPPGGFWIRKNDMQDIVSQRETFAFSQFDGFPALESPLDFSAF